MKKQYSNKRTDSYENSMKEPPLVYVPSDQKKEENLYFHSVEQMIRDVEQSTREIQKGQFYTHEEVKKMRKQ